MSPAAASTRRDRVRPERPLFQRQEQFRDRLVLRHLREEGVNGRGVLDRSCGFGHTVVARLDRATQYAAAFRFNHNRLWNTGSPGRKPGDDRECVARTDDAPYPPAISTFASAI